MKGYISLTEILKALMTEDEFERYFDLVILNVLQKYDAPTLQEIIDEINKLVEDRVLH